MTPACLLHGPETTGTGFRAEAADPRSSRRMKLPFPVLLGPLLAAMLSPPAFGDLPLYEQEPFDRITLNAANDSAVLEVEPVDLPGRIVPEKPRPTDRLRIRLLARPGVDYEVPWQAIEKVELFEQMILAEAERLVAAGKLEEAYDYFAFLRQNHAELPGLNEAMETYVYEEAKTAHRAGQFDLALAMLQEVHRRNPGRAGLDKAMGLATSSLIDEYAEQDDHAAIRKLIGNLAERFPGHDVATRWQARLTGEAGKLLVAAREAAAEGRFGDAARLCRNVAAIWPELPGAGQLAEEIHEKYPRVVVAVDAVDALEGFARPASLVDWHGRRRARLHYRALMELTGAGTDGGEYLCPLGRFATEDLGRRLVFDLRPAVGWADSPETWTGYDLSRHLLRLAEASGSGSGTPWSELLARVSVSEVYRVEVDLRRVHVRPERLLQTIVPPLAWPGPPETVPENGPYRPAHHDAGEAVSTVNDRYDGTEPGQPAEVVERAMAPGQAVAGLRAGTVDVIDRVVPWMLPELRKEASRQGAVIAVEPYAFPLVHCLIPNPNSGLTSRRTFRRAMVYGIDRERILNHLLAGHDTPGCEPADGPFLQGYARDPEVIPRAYDPQLAAALVAVARTELAALTAPDASAAVGTEAEPAEVNRAGSATGVKGGAPESQPARGPLVLAHPANPIAHAASTMIQRHLDVAGVAVSLRPLTAEETAGLGLGRFPDGVDLLYAELAAWEPVVDAVRLFGPGGLCSHGSCYLQLGLRRLADAADWPSASAALNAIHRAVHDEVSIIPLWQLTDHYAYRTDLGGVGGRPVSLYQDVEKWRPTFRFLPE